MSDKVKVELQKGYLIDVHCEKCGGSLMLSGWDKTKLVFFCSCPRSQAYIHFYYL